MWDRVQLIVIQIKNLQRIAQKGWKLQKRTWNETGNKLHLKKKTTNNKTGIKAPNQELHLNFAGRT